MRTHHVTAPHQGRMRLAQALREDRPGLGCRVRGKVARDQVKGSGDMCKLHYRFQRREFLHTVNFLKIMIFKGFETIRRYKTMGKNIPHF